ncbi:phosphate ABC transporter permease PstA [Bacillota bacterium Meth-B3]
MKKKIDWLSPLLRALTWGAALVTLSLVVGLVGYVLVMGVPHLTPALFAWQYNSTNVSMLPAIFSTLMMTLLSLLFAVPLGVGAAIYLVEYARKGSPLVSLVRVTAETLSGIPSIVYGLFGMMFFVTQLKWGYSLLAGAATLSIMILPLIMRTAEEALLSVPASYREGSFGLGAGRLRTVARVALPAAAPGILAGVILGVGRVVGETAALIYTAGTVAQMPTSLLKSVRTLSVHMYALSNEGLYVNQAYATAAVLMALVVLINTLSMRVARRIAKGSLS